jgi:hypothetical protein
MDPTSARRTREKIVLRIILRPFRASRMFTCVNTGLRSCAPARRADVSRPFRATEFDRPTSTDLICSQLQRSWMSDLMLLALAPETTFCKCSTQGFTRVCSNALLADQVLFLTGLLLLAFSASRQNHADILNCLQLQLDGNDETSCHIGLQS